jgi:hypothetical protein
MKHTPIFDLIVVHHKMAILGDFLKIFAESFILNKISKKVIVRATINN